MRLDRIAQREWDRIAPELVRLHLLSTLDLAALTGYCTTFSAAVAARECIRKRGRYVKAKSGANYVNPAVYDLNRALELMRMFLAEFGMSPGTRSRVVTGGGGSPARSSKDTGKTRPATNRLGEPV